MKQLRKQFSLMLDIKTFPEGLEGFVSELKRFPEEEYSNLFFPVQADGQDTMVSNPTIKDGKIEVSLKSGFGPGAQKLISGEAKDWAIAVETAGNILAAIEADNYKEQQLLQEKRRLDDINKEFTNKIK